MKSILIMITCLLNMYVLNAQTNFGNTWLMGNWGYMVNFKSQPIMHDTIFLSGITQTIFSLGKSNICDKNGEVILVSNGMNIYNKLGIFIENGDTLTSKAYYEFDDGSSLYPQSSLFLPIDSQKYYFVMPTCNDTNLSNVWLGGGGGAPKAPFNILNYSIIDMKANGGAGKVVERNIPLIENKEISKTQMMACRHSNGKDWWLLKMMGDSNNIATFLFTQDSVYDKGLQRLPYYHPTYMDQLGQMSFNQVGNLMATTSTANGGKIFLADFDRCYGLLSNYKQIQVPAINWEEGLDSITTGLAFSPNGRFLYTTTAGHIHQYDLQNNSWYLVGGKDTTYAQFNGYVNCALAADNKIYIGNFHGLSKTMSVINNPDQLGFGCNFCPKCLRSKSIATGYMSVPPCMPNYELGAQNCWPLGSSHHALSPQGFDMYPNPTSGVLTLQSESFNVGENKFVVYNALGEQLMQGKFFTQIGKHNLDVSSLPGGIYFVKVNEVVRKVVVE